MAPLEKLFPDQMHSPPTPISWVTMRMCGTWPMTSEISLALHGFVTSVNPRSLGNLSLDAFYELAEAYGKVLDIRFTKED